MATLCIYPVFFRLLEEPYFVEPHFLYNTSLI